MFLGTSGRPRRSSRSSDRGFPSGFHRRGTDGVACRSMGGVPDRTTGKRQARALRFSSRQQISGRVVTKQAKRTFAATSTAANVIGWLARIQVRAGEIGIPEVGGLGEGPQADQAASSRVHSASLVQPARIRYWASSADISTVPSGLTLMCRPEKVCTDPIPQGACRRTRYPFRVLGVLTALGSHAVVLQEIS